MQISGSWPISPPPGATRTFHDAKPLRLLRDGGYRGDVYCEVTSTFSSRPGYDHLAALESQSGRLQQRARNAEE